MIFHIHYIYMAFHLYEYVYVSWAHCFMDKRFQTTMNHFMSTQSLNMSKCIFTFKRILFGITTFMCSNRVPFLLNVFKHESHWKGLSSLPQFLWFFGDTDFENASGSPTTTILIMLLSSSSSSWIVLTVLLSSSSS